MVDVNWHHNELGWEVRIASRTSEVLLSGNLPVSSIDVMFLKGENPATPSAGDPMLASPVDEPRPPPGILYVYSPIQVRVHVYFSDEGTLRSIYNVDSAGAITTVRPPGLAGHHANSAKGIGKGLVAAPLD